MELEQTNYFDAAVIDYDSQFVHSSIGKRQRDRVYSIFEEGKFLEPTKRIFEFNCGTGFDAAQYNSSGHQVIATDASLKMIEYCKCHRSRDIQFYDLKFQDVEKDDHVGNAELVVSNFGGLNCLKKEELQLFVNQLALKLTAKAVVAFVIMPKRCFMEDVYFFFKGKWGKIGRRNSKSFKKVNVNGVEVPTYYHSPRELKQMMTANFDLIELRPVAFFLPPSYLEPFFSKNKWILQILNKFEILFSKWSILAKWSDHFMLIAKKK